MARIDCECQASPVSGIFQLRESPIFVWVRWCHAKGGYFHKNDTTIGATDFTFALKNQLN